MDFKELSQKVLDAPIGNARMTDLKKGSVHTISIEGEKGDLVFLVSDKKIKTPVTPNAIAAMRIVSDASKAVVAITTKDARTSDDYDNLKNSIQREGGVTLTGSTKFTVVHRLRIIDTASDVPIYKNDCYVGYPAYVKATRKISALPATDRGPLYNEENDKLRATGLKPGVVASDDTLQFMPVFTVTN